MTTTPSGVFIRDHFTWLAYFMLAYYSYMQATLGPLMTFLRDELSLNYTVASYHFSAFAFGMIFAGVFGDGISRRWGRHWTFWGGGAGMILGALLLILGQHPILTISGALVMGTIGSFLLVAIQATLADKHGDKRALALTEANIAASFSAGLAPLFVGGFAAQGWGWRAALVLGALVWCIVAVTARHISVPPAKKIGPKHMQPKGKLPPVFWVYWLVILFGVSVEWGFISWGADFLENVVHLARETASMWMSIFFVAMVIGRATGSVLTRTIPSSRLLLAAVITTLIGFPLFWLGQIAPVNIIGLFIAGIGVANLFPLTLSVVTTVAPLQPDTASARVSFGAGVAIFFAPQILGAIADQQGIQSAYGLIGVLLLLATLMVVTANHLALRQNWNSVPVQT